MILEYSGLFVSRFDIISDTQFLSINQLLLFNKFDNSLLHNTTF
ncbi:MAG: hypothetical protein Q8S84_01345 [bacterium]|nr:hypothetical protein [bacterium]MDP3380218.1 hypothetical protein [bacterium]